MEHLRRPGRPAAAASAAGFRGHWRGNVSVPGSGPCRQGTLRREQPPRSCPPSLRFPAWVGAARAEGRARRRLARRAPCSSAGHRPERSPRGRARGARARRSSATRAALPNQGWGPHPPPSTAEPTAAGPAKPSSNRNKFVTFTSTIGLRSAQVSPSPHEPTAHATAATRGYGCAVRYQFVDCRWSLDDPGWGRAQYLEGHIPGAAFLDVERDLAAPPGARGRHPLPGGGRLRARGRRGRDRAGRLRRRLRHARRAPSGCGGCCATSATTTAR